jgi:hypothetical protein
MTYWLISLTIQAVKQEKSNKESCHNTLREDFTLSHRFGRTPGGLLMYSFRSLPGVYQESIRS